MEDKNKKDDKKSNEEIRKEIEELEKLIKKVKEQHKKQKNEFGGPKPILKINLGSVYSRNFYINLRNLALRYRDEAIVWGKSGENPALSRNGNVCLSYLISQTKPDYPVQCYLVPFFAVKGAENAISLLILS